MCDFLKFIETAPIESSVKPLPINHIADSRFLTTILLAESIPVDYLPECEVYKKYCLYFFYGRDAFKIKDKSAYPVCFIFEKEPHADSIFKMFPFDSGAFYNRMMVEFFPETTIDKALGNEAEEHLRMISELEKFSLEQVPVAEKKIIVNFFKNNSSYFKNEPIKDLPLSPGNCISNYHRMITTNHQVLDDRRSSVEIIMNSEVPLSGLKALILPKMDIKYVDGTIVVFGNLKAELERKYSCKVHGYSQTNISKGYNSIHTHFHDYINSTLCLD